MNVFLLLYLLIYLIIWWGYCGYAMFLYLASKLVSKRRIGNEIITHPSITLLVPCCNEEDLVTAKVRNLAELNYPRDKLEVLFLDGNSTDNTVSKLKDAVKELGFMKVIETKCCGKINQINSVLLNIKTDIIVNTDMDADLDCNLLLEMAKEFQSDERVGVFGAYVTPRDCPNAEKLYWKNQNRIRLLESIVHSSSIVIAVCYAFKRGIIDSFPQDVVADDIYLPFEASLMGYRTVYSASAIAYETRCPKSLGEMLRHKFRKSNAYLTEILRFLYRLPYMKFTWKIIYLTKVLQFLMMPWLLLIFLLMTLQFLFLGEQDLIKFLLLFSLGSLFLTHLVFFRAKIKTEEMRGGLFLTPIVFLITVLILLLTGLTYPFFKQTSSYKKI